jgi:hypothetical protein
VALIRADDLRELRRVAKRLLVSLNLLYLRATENSRPGCSGRRASAMRPLRGAVRESHARKRVISAVS